jgi:hypothetical protein
MTVKIKPAIIVFALGAILVLLFMLNSSGYFLKFVLKYRHIHNFTLFNFDMEANIPTYFSSFILLFSGILLGLIAYWTKGQKHQYVLHWAFLSLIFVYISLDETAQIHELLITPLRSMFSLKGIFYFASVIPGIIVAAIFIISYFRFWINLPFRTKIVWAREPSLWTNNDSRRII